MDFGHRKAGSAVAGEEVVGRPPRRPVYVRRMENDRLWGENMTRGLQIVGCIAALAIALVVRAPARADSALAITPSFDSSITSDPNAASIEATINSAISYYTSTFTTKTPITATISFYEMSTGLGQSNTTVYKNNYLAYSTALHAASSGDATDTTVLAANPIAATNPVTGSGSINVKSANGRALGFSSETGLEGPTGIFLGGTFDGAIGLNTKITFPGSTGSSMQYSLFAVTQHEIDEVLGFGSDVGGTGFFLDPAAQDLFRYAGGSTTRNYSTLGDNAFFSLDGTSDIVQYNQDGVGDYGDWHTGGPARVQDAYGTPLATPTLATDAGTPEIITMDAIGYNLAAQNAVPEIDPGSMAGAMTVFGGGMLMLRGRRRRS
jgi:hypothetical protein